MTNGEDEEGRSEGFTFHDKRRLDPQTYEPRPTEPSAGAGSPGSQPGPANPAAAQPGPVRPPGTAQPGGSPAPGSAAADPVPDPVLAAEAALAEAKASEAESKAIEALSDLKRITAEYANYRKRVDRDRELQRDQAVSTVIVELLPILDDVARAREHGELNGGFRAVADALNALATKYGIETYGEVGEVFDPTIHEAMTSEPSDEVDVPTVGAVYQVGYRLHGRVLRAALVAVQDNG